LNGTLVSVVHSSCSLISI